jgi:hypothetical protein
MNDLSIWDDFVEKGKLKEVLFAQTLKKYGDLTPATDEQDKFEHWDIKLEPKDPNCLLIKWDAEDKDLRFDVKSLKHITRQDEELNEDFHFLEIKNINGYPGSIYGKADYMVFEKFKTWVVVDRIKLVEFVEEFLVNPVYCFKKPLPYAIYTRQNKQDEIMLVETNKLEEISTLIIDKKIE